MIASPQFCLQEIESPATAGRTPAQQTSRAGRRVILQQDMTTEDRDQVDETLGITRCVQCGHRLEGEIECPFCSIVRGSKGMNALPKWIYITACFLISPLSVYFVLKYRRLSPVEKVLTLSGCLLWLWLYLR